MINAKKSLGQNFLIDNNVIKKIVNLINIKGKNILEIGPGKGALTDQILKKKPSSLILIEKDYQLFDALKIKYANNKIVSIYNKDILAFTSWVTAAMTRVDNYRPKSFGTFDEAWSQNRVDQLVQVDT